MKPGFKKKADLTLTPDPPAAAPRSIPSLHSSSMVNMLSVLFVDGDPTRPAKTVTDKAYGRTQHFRPLHTDLEL